GLAHRLRLLRRAEDARAVAAGGDLAHEWRRLLGPRSPAGELRRLQERGRGGDGRRDLLRGRWRDPRRPGLARRLRGLARDARAHTAIVPLRVGPGGARAPLD